jgi:hypothetical protein
LDSCYHLPKGIIKFGGKRKEEKRENERRRGK